MKKLIPVLVILILLLAFVLAVFVFDLPSQIGYLIYQNSTEEEQPVTDYSVYSDGDLLMLPVGEEYKVMAGGGTYEDLYVGPYHIMVDPIAYSSITPNEGYAFPTLEEFFSTWIVGEDAVFETDGDLIYVIHETQGKTDYSFFFESANSFWWVQFTVSESKVEQEEAVAQFKEWANAITITDAAE